MRQPGKLRELAAVFLRLGTIAFGGPAAHVAMMEDEVVRRRQWLTREEFLDYWGATNFIPGPNSTELAIHIGHARAGWAGLLVAGVCFILPAACIVTVIAWAYVRFGGLPATAAALYGIKPVVIAVVLQALWRLGWTALKTGWLAALGVAALVASLFGVHELLILFGSGAIMAVVARAVTRRRFSAPAAGLLLATVSPIGATGGAGLIATAIPVGLPALFLVFAKTGALLFGSGYVLLAFLRADLVQRLGWLTEHQLLDAVAVGQVTPGPVFTTATFVGYLLAGGAGAFVATIGIFLPAFVFVALSGPLLPHVRRSPTARAVLDGVNIASLALMTAVTVQLGRAALVDWYTVLLSALSAVLLLRYRMTSAWLVLGGATIGVVMAWWRGGL